MKKTATNAARRLREKLAALVAAPGTPDEGNAAQAKLARLDERYDFGQVDVAKEFLFAGKFTSSANAAPIAIIADWPLGAAVKWAIESATGIHCSFNGSELRAEATNGTVKKLSGIADTISGGFNALWAQFATFPTVTQADRALFLRGLYDGMMADQKPLGERLPARISQPTRKHATRRAVGYAAGVMVHPYNIAVELGKSIRFNVPLPELKNQLNAQKPKELK
jgi:hypothetical protein